MAQLTEPVPDSDPDVLASRTACALAGRTAEQILDVLSTRTTLERIRGSVSGPVAGLLMTMRGRTKTKGPDLRLRSVHACLTTSSKVEACVVVAEPNRIRSLALRLERTRGQWVCTMLAVV